VPGEPFRSSIPTEPAPTDLRRQRRARMARRGFVTLLVAFLGLGALGLVGVRTRTASVTGGGYELSLHYATIARPGLDVPWTLTVRHPGGFPDGVTVVVTSDYLDKLDQNGVSPAPGAETSDAERTIWRFGPPPGDVLTVSLDAQIQAGVQLTRAKGRVEVFAGSSRAAAAGIGFSTLVMP
jgi:hypothetical protein